MGNWIGVSRWSRSFHRWIAYGLGAVVALWTVTGVVMILPPPAPALSLRPAAIEPTAATRSPGEAAQALPARHAPVRTVTLRDLGGRLVYHFVMQNGRHEFVDATTAQRVEFNDSLAAALAQRASVAAAATRVMARISQHDARYPSGVLPVFRIELNDARRTVVHVAADGAVSSTSNRSRFRALMGGLHSFQLPRHLIPNRPRKLLLIAASVLTIVLTLTGYVLTLPLKRRSQRAQTS